MPRLGWALAAVIAVACMTWLASGVANGDTMMFDRNMRRQAQIVATPGLTQVMKAVTLLGSQAVLLTVTGCAALGLLIARRWKQAGLMAGAMAGAELLLWILKMSFHRHRPDPFFDLPVLPSYSFPSGHALLSLCCYGTLSAVVTDRRLVRIAAAVLILTIGISRVYLGMHYATDVIGGYLAGAAWMSCLAFFCNR